jgi:ABC-2 type transport system permease protein
MPNVIQKTAQYLPFQLFIYFPIQIIQGKLTSGVILQNFGLGAIWLVIAFGVFQLVWREGVKRFSAVGA